MPYAHELPLTASRVGDSVYLDVLHSGGVRGTVGKIVSPPDTSGRAFLVAEYLHVQTSDGETTEDADTAEGMVDALRRTGYAPGGDVTKVLDGLLDSRRAGLYAALVKARKVRTAALAEVDEATLALRAEVDMAASMGVPETKLADLAGVSRMTIRSWLGK